MKPAACYLCGKFPLNESAGKNCDWVKISDYTEEGLSSLDHSSGLIYFCSDHLTAALQISNSPSTGALKNLREQFPSQDSAKENIDKIKPWWKHFLSGFNWGFKLQPTLLTQSLPSSNNVRGFHFCFTRAPLMNSIYYLLYGEAV